MVRPMDKTNKENRGRKSPGRFAFLALALVGFWELAGGYILMLILRISSVLPMNASSVGVIGGADGPTAIFFTSSVQSWFQYVLAVLMIVVGIVGFVKLRNPESKE